jgi:two-component system chemotaxis sensor kinase CheA
LPRRPLPRRPQRPRRPPSRGEQTVRISTAKLTALLLQAEELLAFKHSAEHLADDLHGLHTELGTWRKSWERTVAGARAAVRAGERRQGSGGPQAPAIERLLDAAERDALLAKTLSDRCAQIERNAWQERRALAGMVDNLLADMKQTLMLPFSTLLEMAPRLVRDLAHDSGKEAGLSMDGGAVEIDRRILEPVRDPCCCTCSRNAVDHGIEAAGRTAARASRKPVRARLAIAVVTRATATRWSCWSATTAPASTPHQVRRARRARRRV